MAKARSPNYPMLDFGAALQAARKAYEKDHRNKMSRAVLAKHLGHESLSGPALGKLGALRAYGLIDGAGDELRITDEAVHALMAPEGSPERTTAMSQLALRPKLFQEIRKDFPGAVSLENLKFWLIKRSFVPDAAEKAAKVYLGSIKLASDSGQDYDSVEETDGSETSMQTGYDTLSDEAKRVLSLRGDQIKKPIQEVFHLPEGSVTITFPGKLSIESYQDLEDQLSLILRRVKRSASTPEN